MKDKWRGEESSGERTHEVRGDLLAGVWNGGEARESVFEDEHTQRVDGEHEHVHAQVELEVVHQERLHTHT